jgi:hypothetical protein
VSNDNGWYAMPSENHSASGKIHPFHNPPIYAEPKWNSAMNLLPQKTGRTIITTILWYLNNMYCSYPVFETDFSVLSKNSQFE